MAVSIDRSGRILIPKPLRDAAGLSPGRPLQIEIVDGAVVIKPVPGAKRRNEFLEGLAEFRRRHKVRLSREELLKLCDDALEIDL